jgi:peptide/nickel transport system permease protein
LDTKKILSYKKFNSNVASFYSKNDSIYIKYFLRKHPEQRIILNIKPEGEVDNQPHSSSNPVEPVTVEPPNLNSNLSPTNKLNDSILINEYTGSDSRKSYKSFLLADIIEPLNSDNFNYSIQKESISFTTIDGIKNNITLSELQSKAKAQIVIKTFYLGTDKFGRDMFSRLIIGVRISLSVGLIAVIISIVIGVLLGALAGYFRGWLDEIIMWFINVIWSVPTLLLVFAMTLAIGKGFWQIFIAVGLTMWVEAASIVRGQVLSLREMQYVEAAHSLGYSHVRIIFLHILPNTVGPLAVIAATNFASAIIIEAGLSFLGIGVQPPTPSWGGMLNENYGYIIGENPFLAIIPGIAIMIMVLAFNFVGNGLRDAMDVKTSIDK